MLKRYHLNFKVVSIAIQMYLLVVLGKRIKSVYKQALPYETFNFKTTLTSTLLPPFGYVC